MGISTLLGSLLKSKVMATVLVSTAVVGGATAAAAASPVGQNIVNTVMSAKATVTTGQSQKPDQDNNKSNQSDAHANNKDCPGLAEAQNLAAKFSLSTDSKSDDIQAICELHQGKFKGTTTGGATVTSNQVLGYGEIDGLLTMATKANTASKLTSANARSLLADALKSCGTMQVMACVNTKAPDTQSGDGHSTNGDNNGGKGTGGKPESTPTPPAHH